MVQSSKYLVKTALNIAEQRIIGPTLHLAHGPRALADAVRRSLPEKLRPAETVVLRAVHQALAAQAAFLTEVTDRGQEILSRVPETEPVWIVSGRPYNLHDERLSLGLGRLASRLGIKAVPTDFLSLSDMELTTFRGMYWGLGAVSCGGDPDGRDTEPLLGCIWGISPAARIPFSNISTDTSWATNPISCSNSTSTARRPG
jgi:predicted nucleotide-binding protein (sugar kinase/HSP70/actin superfamily)